MCALRSLALMPMTALVALSTSPFAQAQMVPKAGHALHQARSGDVTEARITWHPVAPGGLRSPDDTAPLDGRRLLRHWEGRVGAMIDRPANPMHDPLGASHATPPGLRLRSLHLLSDYYLAGGLRATAGVVGGDTAQAWWGAGERGGGLNLSLQRIDGPAAGLEQGRTPPPRSALCRRRLQHPAHAARLADRLASQCRPGPHTAGDQRASDQRPDHASRHRCRRPDPAASRPQGLGGLRLLSSQPRGAPG